MSDRQPQVFRMGFYLPPNRLTFETAAELKALADNLDLPLSFVDFTGRFLYSSVPTPYEHQVLDWMTERDAIPTTMECEGHWDFARYFGRGVKLTYQRMKAYCLMCEEGKVW